MPSRLSSLLVRDGLVGVKRMEKAFQRQVIYGGSLDTILLEMNLVPEDRLTQYLALASGLPPAKRDEAERIEPAALALVNGDISLQFRAVPLQLGSAGQADDSQALRVLVCSPLEIDELEDLADLLDRPLQPLITPEYRWHLAHAQAYRAEPPARFTTLSRTLEIEATPTPVGRARSVIIEQSQPPPTQAAGAVLAPIAPDDKTMKVGAREPALEPKKRNTLVGITVPVEAPPTRPSRASEKPRSRNDGVPEEPFIAPQITFAPPQVSVPIVATVAPTPARAKRQSEPVATQGRDSPLAIVRARELLATAEDRDTVFLTLLRAARSKARYAALLTVQGGAAIGRVALAEAGVDVGAIANVLVPLDVVSPFRSVVNNQQPHIGALGSGDLGIDAMIVKLGGSMPPSALILPIVLRDRVVAIVVAHSVHSDLKLVDVSELLPLGSAAADALGRLIVKHKAAGYRVPEANTGIPVDASDIDTKKHVRGAGPAGWSAPPVVASPTLPSFDDEAEVSIATEPPRTIDEIVEHIETAKEGAAEHELDEAVERSVEVLGALMRKFPGVLRVDRFSVAGRPLRAAQYGGLLELVVRLGSVASELLIDKMGDPNRDIRFFATICTAELRPRSAVFALVERLFDPDYGVRATAIEALSGYPLGDLSQPLARVRRAIHSSDPEVVAASTAAIVALGDTDAIGDLIGAIERSDRGGEHVRKALIALSAQDFGTNERKWRKWYEGARRLHRIEWLIEGLGHKEDAVREASIQDLRRLTGEYFGYHHDLPRKDRDAAAERWISWWKETGMRRFVLPKEDERHRPTGVLPSRSDGK
ncbi:hypothetical protein BH11MYX1_BH11MYX1_32580 [soil metagenome]